ncbi:hypothetical protein XarjCFBP7652_20575 [Xanthomonas arboricola]|nr:hypothetical protein XarjCFBP7652_20575 [Xanthomonas arboricola]
MMAMNRVQFQTGPSLPAFLAEYSSERQCARSWLRRQSDPQASSIERLLLINALATFVAWLAGLACEATGIDQCLYSAKRRHKLYSTLRIGREALIRHWPMAPVWNWLQRLRELPEHVLDQMVAPA